jgi:hypothetical protein
LIVRARRCALGLVLLAGCGDRSPPALWPEPPPPTLAKPIGIDEPVRAATDVSGATEGGAPDGAPAEGGVDATAQPAKTSADEPSRPGGEPPITAEPKPGERMPMPPLTP